MPRINRVAVGGIVYHVLNRANGRVRIFANDADYRHFEGLLEEAVLTTGMRLLSYCIMPNHWHLVLYPERDQDMGLFMHWLTTTHVRQRRAFTETIGHGHLYQGAYKSFPVETNEYLLQLIRYVEQNPLRARLVKKAEDWRWSSLWRRVQGREQGKKVLAELPIDLPHEYPAQVNTLFDDTELTTIRHAANKGTPYGGVQWTDEMVTQYNLGSTLRGQGRPRKQ